MKEDTIQFGIRSRAKTFNTRLQHAAALADRARDSKLSTEAESRLLLLQMGTICQNIVQELQEEVLR